MWLLAGLLEVLALEENPLFLQIEARQARWFAYLIEMPLSWLTLELHQTCSIEDAALSHWDYNLQLVWKHLGIPQQEDWNLWLGIKLLGLTFGFSICILSKYRDFFSYINNLQLFHMFGNPLNPMTFIFFDCWGCLNGLCPTSLIKKKSFNQKPSIEVSSSLYVISMW